MTFRLGLREVLFGFPAGRRVEDVPLGDAWKPRPIVHEPTHLCVSGWHEARRNGW